MFSKRTSIIYNFSKQFSFITLICAIILASMQVIGCKLSIMHHTTVHTLLFDTLSQIPEWLWAIIWFIEILLFYFVLYFLFRTFTQIRYKETRKTINPQTPKYIFILGFCGMIICWTPYLLANLPGFFNYDISGQLIQVMYADLNDFSTHHSLISTLLMGGLITLGYKIFGTLFAGILLYSCFQILICGLVFSYTLLFIYKKTSHFLPTVFAFLFYALSPTIAMFTTSTTKDVLCSLLLLLSSTFLFDMLEDFDLFFSNWKRPFALFLFLTLAALFRKNIIYAIILYCIICTVFNFKKMLQCLVLLAASIITFFTISFALEKALDAIPGGAAEAFSIPFQQIGYLYNTEGNNAFTDIEWSFLNEMMPEGQWEKYNPFISDSLKNYIHTDYFVSHKKEFLSLWIKKFFQYPIEYIKAFLNLTYQAWYPGTSIYDGEIYYFDFYGGNYRIEKTSYLPSLTDFCQKISLDFYYQKIPVIRLFFSVGFMFWTMLVCATFGIYTKQKSIYGTVALALCVCLTCLAGPISLVRYYLILFYAFPVYIAFFFYNRKEPKDN